MSSNNNSFVPLTGGSNTSNESKLDLASADSIQSAIQQQQRGQLLQHQLQQISNNYSLNAQQQVQQQVQHQVQQQQHQQQQQQMIAAMMKRQAADALGDSTDPSGRSQKRVRNMEDPQQQAQDSLSLLNSAWGTNVMLEPTPLMNGVGNSFSSNPANIDLMMLRDMQMGLFNSANQAHQAPSTSNNGSSGLLSPSGMGLADQLRLSAAASDASAQLLQDTRSSRPHSLLGSLAATNSQVAGPYDSLFSAPPTAAATHLFQPQQAPAAHTSAASIMFGGMDAAQQQQINQAFQQIPSLNQVGPNQDPTGAGNNSNLNLMMQQLAAMQNTGNFGGMNSLLAAQTTANPVSAPDSAFPQGFSADSSASRALSNMVATTNATAASQDSSLPRGFPPLEENNSVAHFSERPKFCLGVDEDPNWLSEFHCFVRSELTEVCRANHDDCKTRNNAIAFEQAGIRCRFCAHKPANSRAGRSSAFPSSLRQIYQSFTMMLREHFPNCDCMPAELQEKFATLKDTPSQGATDSKRYWMYSAIKLGMSDSDGEQGIIITEQSIAAGAKAPPFGTNSEIQAWPDQATEAISLVEPSDRQLNIDEFLYVLLSQCQVVRLTDSEKIGNRRSLQIGLPGVACRACCQARRLGLCRLFPARRRTLPSKLSDLYDHFRRCSLAPKETQLQLERLKKNIQENSMNDRDDSKEFFDRVWTRMGHSKPGKHT